MKRHTVLATLALLAVLLAPTTGWSFGYSRAPGAPMPAYGPASPLYRKNVAIPASPGPAVPTPMTQQAMPANASTAQLQAQLTQLIQQNKQLQQEIGQLKSTVNSMNTRIQSVETYVKSRNAAPYVNNP